MNQREKAALLRRLHYGPSILRLCNVWDAASARIVEQAGFPAAATSSAGVAYALGYPDGEAIPLGEMLAQVQRIARAVSIPVTADLEAGYEDIERTAAGLVQAGAAGLNLEDFHHGKLVDLAAQIDKIRAVRRFGEREGVPIVINARTDVYARRIADAKTLWEGCMDRLLAFKDAGADCVFVPGVTDEQTIGRMVSALQFPLNILPSAGSPTVGRLQELGVARVSLGSGPMRAAMGLMRRIAEQFRDSGTYSLMLESPFSYADANQLMANKQNG